jgi:hypothetical protein
LLAVAFALICNAQEPATAMSSSFARTTASRLTTSRSVAIGAATLTAMAVVATLVLWAHYGTAVFYEIIAAGIAACL